MQRYAEKRGVTQREEELFSSLCLSALLCVTLCSSPFLWLQYQMVNGRVFARNGALTLDANEVYSQPPVVTITGGAQATTTDTTPIHVSPDNASETFPIEVGTGSKVAIIEFVDGFAKVLYWRSYGYIDVTLLNGVSAANLVNALASAFYRFPTAPTSTRIATPVTSPSGEVGASRFAIYCNRPVASALDRQAMNKSNVLLNLTEWDGRPVTTFRGIPIRVVDSILSTESRVV